MEQIIWGIAFLLAAVLLVWLGIRRRRNAQRNTRMMCSGTRPPRS